MKEILAITGIVVMLAALAIWAVRTAAEDDG